MDAQTGEFSMSFRDVRITPVRNDDSLLVMLGLKKSTDLSHLDVSNLAMFVFLKVTSFRSIVYNQIQHSTNSNHMTENPVLAFWFNGLSVWCYNRDSVFEDDI